MADLFSRQLLAQGFSPKRVADARRLQQEQNALAQILNQQQIDQNKANLRATQLDNTQRAREMAQKPGLTPYQAAQLKQRKAEFDFKKQQAQQPKMSESKKALIQFLPPELQVDPTQATNQDFVMAAIKRAEEAAKPSLAERKFEYEKKNPKTPKRSAQQSNAEGFYDRMISANSEIDRVVAGADGEIGTADDYSPITFGEAVSSVTNATASNEYQRYRQAAENWIRANLRKESGAVIGPEEMQAEFENYFPVFGDKPGVIAQKARNRKVTEEAMRKAAGVNQNIDIFNQADAILNGG